MIRSVKVDCATITDWTTFHDVFARAFGFPAYYGGNLDAWVDCMSNLDEEVSGLELRPGDCVLLQLEHADVLKRAAPEILAAILELAAFVNFRRIEIGQSPILISSCNA